MTWLALWGLGHALADDLPTVEVAVMQEAFDDARRQQRMVVLLSAG